MEGQKISKGLERAKKETYIDTFFAGVRKGWAIEEKSIIPSVIMCYSLLAFLQVTGLVDILATIFKPAMGIFGLPGEGVISLVAGFFSKSTGCATAASLFAAGSLNARHVTILLVGNMAYGGILPQWPRTIVTSGTDSKLHLWMMLLLPIGGAFAMILANLLLAVI
jgi:spore maturation protein SpmB